MSYTLYLCETSRVGSCGLCFLLGRLAKVAVQKRVVLFGRLIKPFLFFLKTHTHTNANPFNTKKKTEQYIHRTGLYCKMHIDQVHRSMVKALDLFNQEAKVHVLLLKNNTL